MGRGFFAIGIEHGKNTMNVGTLWRSANILGAAFIFTVGRRYKRQSSDTLKTWRHVPLMHFETLDDLHAHLPYDTMLVGVEMEEDATPLPEYSHPERCCYLLGAEDHGLTDKALDLAHQTVVIPGDRSMNVAVAGSVVMYDRIAKAGGLGRNALRTA